LSLDSQLRVGVKVKGLVNFVLKNKLAVWLLTIIITASGIYSGTRMKMESIPDISIPYLIVMGVYPGATPEQVMDELSIPFEKTIESLEDVKAVYSTSSSNVASISIPYQVQVEYDYGIDMDEKKRQLEAALDNLTLPEGAQEPTIMAISMNMMPVVALSVSSSTEDIVDLTSTVEDILLPKIEKIDGVASATITGQHIEQVSFKYDEEKMDAPYIVAKGVDHLALKIRKIAKEHDVMMVENRPLARALYDQVEIDQAVPEEFFKVLAEILAYVYKTKQKVY